MKTNYYVLLGMIALAGCGSKGGGGYTPTAAKPVEMTKLAAGEEQSLLPLVKGNQWTFTIEQTTAANGQNQRSTGEVTFRLAEVTPMGDGNKGVFELLVNGEVTDRQVWLVNSKGIYQLAIGKGATPFTPMQPAVTFPLEDNREFAWKGTGITPTGVLGSSTISNKVIGFQEVDTEAGRVGAYCIESKVDGAANGKKFASVTQTWWQPKVGFVRLKQTIVVQNAQQIQTLRLKSFSPAAK